MAEAALPRVLFVDQSGAIGGAELSLLDLVRSRGSVGDTVALLSEGPFADRLQSVGAATHLLPLSVDVQKASGFWQQLSAVPRVIAVARRLAAVARQHDLLYANTQKAAIVGAVSAWLSGKPMVWHLRDMLDADHFSGANRRVVVAVTNRSAKLVIANSQATADAYRRAGGRVALSIVHNGVDASPFASLDDQLSETIRTKLGTSQETPLVGAFGRLTPWKGQHVLLDALSTPQLAGVHAVFVGEALFTDEDRAYAETLRARSREEPLAGRIHWLGHRDDIPELMRACDLIVHSATQPEPFGRVLVEAMLAARPTVAADAGGAQEILTDGVTGLLTPPGDADALAGAMGRIVSDRTFSSKIAAAGRAEALARFGLEDRVAELNALIADTA